MSNTLLILKREYLERVKTKAFIFMTLLVPGVMALSFGAAYLTAQHAGQDQHIAIASNDAALALAVRDQLGDSKTAPIHADVIAPADESQQNALIQRVNDKQLDGYLWLGVKTGQATEVQYDTHASPDLFVSSRIQDAVDNAQVRMKLEDKGFQKADVDLLMKQVTVTTAQVKDGKVVTSDAGKSFWVGYLMMFLLYFSVTYFSMNVARSVIQEKTSRIFEVMLATVKPSDMMAGKMLGVGAAGLSGLYLTSGLDSSMDAVFGAARRLRVPTISASLACVEQGHCVVGFTSEPTVQILLNEGAAERTGVHFLQAFRMLVREK